MPQVLYISLLYFFAVFTAGFVLGTARVLLLVDLVGERYAELAEMPLMIFISCIVARLLMSKYSAKLTAVRAFSVGVIALALLLAVEFSVVLALRGLSVAEYLDSRDLISGAAYIVGLTCYALAPVAFYIARSRSCG